LDDVTEENSFQRRRRTKSNPSDHVRRSTWLRKKEGGRQENSKLTTSRAQRAKSQSTRRDDLSGARTRASLVKRRYKVCRGGACAQGQVEKSLNLSAPLLIIEGINIYRKGGK